MKELCFKEARDAGMWNDSHYGDYCNGKNCPNYPCDASVAFDKLTKYPACHGDTWCHPKRCKSWDTCPWNK